MPKSPCSGNIEHAARARLLTAAALICVLARSAYGMSCETPPARCAFGLPSLPEPQDSAAAGFSIAPDKVELHYNSRTERWKAAATYDHQGKPGWTGEYGLRLGERLAAGTQVSGDSWRRNAAFRQVIGFSRRTRLRLSSAHMMETFEHGTSRRTGDQYSQLLEIRRWARPDGTGPAVGMTAFKSHASMPGGKEVSGNDDGEAAASSSATQAGYKLSFSLAPSAVSQLQVELGKQNLRQLRDTANAIEQNGQFMELQLVRGLGACRAFSATIAGQGESRSAHLDYVHNRFKIALSARNDDGDSTVSIVARFAIPLGRRDVGSTACRAPQGRKVRHPGIVEDALIRSPSLPRSFLISS